MNIGAAPPRHATDPGAPRVRGTVVWVLGVAAASAGAGTFAGGTWGHLGVLAAMLIVAELLPVRLGDGSEMPTSVAVVLPLAVAAAAGPFVAVVGAAQAVAAVARDGRPIRDRARRAIERGTGAFLGYGVYRLATSVGGTAALARIGSLALAAVGMILWELLIRRRRRLESFGTAGGYAASFAGASGILMALALDGVEGRGAMGLWGLPVFALPMLSARWAFDRLHAIRRTHDQTIDVLSLIPELSGRTPPGHARRVAELAVEIGEELRLARPALDDLERAALLYSLGHVTLEALDGTDDRLTLGQVGAATAEILADERPFSGPAGLVATSVATHDQSPLTADESRAAEVLRVATAFEQTVAGDPFRSQAALELAVRSAGGVGDGRVIAALEAVVLRRVRAAV